MGRGSSTTSSIRRPPLAFSGRAPPATAPSRTGPARGSIPTALTASTLAHAPVSFHSPAAGSGEATVGAVNWQGPSFAYEPYSSRGPTTDGRIKPDVMGYAAVSNATLPVFRGTSAAAPHVAGAAALLRQAFPAFTPAQIRTF